MPIIVVCPGCSANLNAPDIAAGKKVKCPRAECGKLVPVPEPPSDDIKVVEDDPQPQFLPEETVTAELDDDPPPKKKRRDEEDERPKIRRKDEGFSRRKKINKRQEKAGMPPALLVGIILGGLLLVCGVGYGIYALTSGSDTSIPAGLDIPPPAGSLTSKAEVPSGWTEFRPVTGGFKAYFPSMPREKQTQEGTLFEGRAYKSFFAVLRYPAPSNFSLNSKNDVANAIFSTAFDGYVGREVSRKESTLAGMSASESTLEVFPEARPIGPTKGKMGGKSGVQFNKPGQAILRVLSTERKLYILCIINEDGPMQPALANGFFDNFELTQ
jgi:hypothetical protein